MYIYKCATFITLVCVLKYNILKVENFNLKGSALTAVGHERGWCHVMCVCVMNGPLID